MPYNSRVADIGCDHAYTSIYLVQNKIADYCIAMDIKEGPLARAKENIKKYECEDKIEVRLSDGLTGLRAGEADIVLISGMGGLLICEILKKAGGLLTEIKELIVQPQSEQGLVREYLHQLMFEIKEETMLQEDGKFYVSIHAIRNSEKILYSKKIDYLFGKVLLDKKDSCLLEYLQNRQKKYRQILSVMEHLGKTEENEDYYRIKETLSDMEEALQRY